MVSVTCQYAFRSEARTKLVSRSSWSAAFVYFLCVTRSESVFHDDEFDGEVDGEVDGPSKCP